MQTQFSQHTPGARNALVNLNNFDAEAFSRYIGLHDFLVATARAKAADLTVAVDAAGIARAAESRVWDEARRYFAQQGQPATVSALANYLKHFGGRWASRFVERVAKGKPLPPAPAPRCSAAPAPCGPPVAPASAVAPPAPAEAADPLLADCVSVLTDQGVNFTAGPDLWPIQFSLPSAGVVCDVQLFGPQERLFLFGNIPMLIPEAKRVALAMRILGINWSLPEGGFEMDPATGRLRFCVSLSRSEAAPARIRELIAAGSWALREHAADLLRCAVSE